MEAQPTENKRQNRIWKILVIDTVEDDVLTVRDMLTEGKGRKVEVHWAATAAAGLAELARERYDAVLVEYDLGEHSGIDLIREANERKYPSPFILFTGRGSYEVDLEAMQAGATLYLTKGEASPLLLERAIRYAIERKQAEAALEKSKAELSLQARLIELSYEPIMIWDLQDGIQSWNAGCERLYGYSRAEALGQVTHDLLHTRHPDDRGTFLDLLRADKYWTGELHHQTRDGREVIVESRQELLEIDGKQLVLETNHDITERRQVEEALRKSEEKFAKSFRSSPVAICISTVADGRFVEVNDSYTLLFGFSREELVGNTSLALGMLPDPQTRQEIIQRFRAGVQPALTDPEQVRAGVQPALTDPERVRAGRGFRNYELRMRTKTGEDRDVLFSTEPIEIDGQECMLSLVIDITERKRAEDALRESESSMREILQSTHDQVFILDRDWRFQYVNRHFAETYQVSQTEYIGKNIWEVFPGYIGTLLERQYRKVMEERTPVQFEIGSIYSGAWYEISAYPTQEGISVFAADRTEAKKAQQERIEGEKRLRRLMEGNIIGINVRDAAGRIQDANPAFLQMIGYTCDDLAAGSLSIQDITSSTYLEIDRQAIEQAKAAGSCKPYEKEYLHKDGHAIPALVAYTRLDENAERSSEEQSSVERGSEELHSSERFIGYVLDLTERKQAQTDLQAYAEKLKQSNQELEQFAFVASHDLQEPLRKIRLFGNMIQGKMEGKLDAETRDAFQRMMNASERMQVMIADLLELSRVNRQNRPFTQVDLSSVVAEVVSDLEPRIQRTKGQVLVSLAEQAQALPGIEADPIQMHQVFQNLIGNALKFHKPGTPPIVKVSSAITKSRVGKSPMLTIQVEDNGIGFEEQHFEKILQPFQRLHGRSEYEGTGIGLAIVKKIIERHHGQISARSVPEEGSTFIVTLPLKQAN